MRRFKLRDMADFVKFVEELPEKINEAAMAELKPQADGIAEDFKEKARKHSMPVKLSPEAADEAGPALAAQLTRVSPEYVDSIRAEAVGDKVRVGVSSDKVPSTDKTYQDLGRIYEFGSSAYGVPARPHIRPALAELSQAKSRMEESMKSIFDKILRGR